MIEVSDHHHTSAVSQMGKDPLHPLTKGQMGRSTGQMFSTKGKSLASGKKKNHIRSSFQTITILTELPLKVIFYTVHINLDSICRCVEVVYTSRQNCILLYIYITKSNSLSRCDGYVKASGQNSTVLYTLHHAEFFITISFSVVTSHIENVSANLLELCHDYGEKTVH